MDERLKEIKEKIMFRSDGDAKLIHDLIQAFEQQQEEINQLSDLYDKVFNHREEIFQQNQEKDAEIKLLKEGINTILKYMEDHSGTIDVPKRLTTDGLFDLYRLTKKLIR